MKCDRCGTNCNIYKVSFFNTDNCCMTCIGKEKKHKLYNKAVKEEIRQCKMGNYNFKGIGLPNDLRS